jgi:hypothetical protein
MPIYEHDALLAVQSMHQRDASINFPALSWPPLDTPLIDR